MNTDFLLSNLCFIVLAQMFWLENEELRHSLLFSFLIPKQQTADHKILYSRRAGKDLVGFTLEEKAREAI